MSGREGTRSARTDRLLARLAQPGARLCPLPGEGTRWGVFAEGDRRRRPCAIVSAAELARLRSDGALAEAEGAERLVLSAAGRMRLRRAEAPQDAGPFRRQHALFARHVEIGPDGEVAEREVDEGDSPLAWLARHTGPDGASFLAARERAAGERLRADMALSRLQGRVTQDWEAPLSRPRGRRYGAARRAEPSERAHAAGARVAAALAALGPGLDQVVEAVCRDGRGLDAVERGLGWPRRSAKVVLKIALARLADHYGLARAS